MNELFHTIKELDPYEVFFAILGLIVLGALIGAAYLVIRHDSIFPYVYPIATLFATAIMLRGASAKQVFWMWVSISILFAVLGIIFGNLILWVT